MSKHTKGPWEYVDGPIGSRCDYLTAYLTDKGINAVQAELAKTGIAKDKRNAQQGYNFRGIDDVYAAVAAAVMAPFLWGWV